MNILVTLDSNYLKPLKVMLLSLFYNNPGQCICIYVVHSSITDGEIDELRSFIKEYNNDIHSIRIDNTYFKNAPEVMYYSREMYYRLLSHKFLPQDIDKALYLDPDILVINPLNELYKMDMENFLYGAAYHARVPVKEINKLRLQAYEMDEYFNSGVLMMNLSLQRKKIDEHEIFNYVERYKNRLIMPDQDILNALYSRQIKDIDEIKYNYDPRYYQYNKIISNGKYDMDYIMRNTSIIHFCGKKKPWHKNYNGKFHALYKHYEILALERERNLTLNDNRIR